MDKAKAETAPDAGDELVQHLEKLTGRTFKTREDIQAYVREVSTRQPRNDPSLKRWVKAKRLAMAALLAYSVIQYYILDIMLEIVSLPSTTFFVPARATLKSLLDIFGPLLA